MLTPSKVVFKDDNPKENLLFPPGLSELTGEKHPVKMISGIILMGRILKPDRKPANRKEPPVIIRKYF